jgi:hypothetical protein
MPRSRYVGWSRYGARNHERLTQETRAEGIARTHRHVELAKVDPKPTAAPERAPG